jgi:hypothetical protein
MSNQTLLSLAPLLLTAAAIVVTLWLFFQLKTEIARLRIAPSRTLSEMDKQEPEIDKQELDTSLRTFLIRLERLEERYSLALSPPASPGFNLGKRTHVLRLSRRGDSPDHIAATLHLPRREVELLLKIHDLSLHSAPGAKPETIH